MRVTALVGICITIVLAILAVWNINLLSLAEAFAQANYALVSLAALVWASGYAIRSFRWRTILGPDVDASLVRVAKVLFIGFLGNNVLPARIGEFVRAFVLSKVAGTSKSFGLATILIERMFDGLALVCLLMLTTQIYRPPNLGVEITAITTFAVAVFLALLFLVIFALARRELLLRLAEFFLSLMPDRVARFGTEKSASFLAGLEALRRPERAVVISVCSLGIWCIEALAYGIVLMAFDVKLAGIQWVAAPLLMVVVINLGIMLPSAPGHLGSFHFFGKLALVSAFGIDDVNALAIVVVAHAVQYVLVSGAGLLSAASESLSWSSLQAAKAG